MNLRRLLDAISEILSARYDTEISAKVENEKEDKVGRHTGS